MQVRRPVLAFAAALLAAPAMAQEPSRPILLKGGTVIRIDGPVIERGSVLIRGGKIVAVGADIGPQSNATIIDCRGRYILPGIIDVHSHMGVYSWPSVRANSDGNEAAAPVTAEVRAADSVNVEDPAFERARAGGVTTVLSPPCQNHFFVARKRP